MPISQISVTFILTAWNTWPFLEAVLNTACFHMFAVFLAISSLTLKFHLNLHFCNCYRMYYLGIYYIHSIKELLILMCH